VAGAESNESLLELFKSEHLTNYYCRFLVILTVSLPKGKLLLPGKTLENRSARQHVL